MISEARRPRIEDMLRAAGQPLGPVNNSLRFPGLDPTQAFEFSTWDKGRIVALSEESRSIYDAMRAAGLPVFDTIPVAPEGLIYLAVPAATYLLRSRLTNLKRAPFERLAPIIGEVVGTQVLQSRAGLGVVAPTTSMIADRFALVEDRTLKKYRAVILPPFDVVDYERRPSEFADQIVAETAQGLKPVIEQSFGKHVGLLIDEALSAPE